MPKDGRKHGKKPVILDVPKGMPSNVPGSAGGIQAGRPIQIIDRGTIRTLPPSDGGMSTNPGIVPTIDERSIRAPARNRIDQALAKAKAQQIVADTGGAGIIGTGSEAGGGNNSRGI